MKPRPSAPIRDADDPRLAPYLHMRDRNLRAEHGGARFLAEGRMVVERAVAHGIELESVLVVASKADAVRGLVPASTRVLACAKEVMAEAAGFALHQGVVAVGRVPAPVSLRQVVADARAAGRPGTLVVCPEVTNVDNVGLLIRVAAGLGADAMVLGPRCADPWYRRAVRTSMGTVFSLPVVRYAVAGAPRASGCGSDPAPDLDADLGWLADTAGYDLVATVIDGDAPALDTLVRGDAPDTGTAVLLGSEGYGLNAGDVARCTRRVRIPMHHGVDSLNVAVAAGIVLYEVMRPPPE